MDNEKSALDGFLADSAAVLHQTEINLSQLAQAALANSQPLPTSLKSEATPDTLRLQQIGQQLAKLSQRSHTLKTYLQNGLETPPVDDDYWPRIRILQSQEEERAQVARELEDNVGQLLANAIFELASCRHLLSSEAIAVTEGLDALQRELEQGLANMRQLITDLEPASILNNFGLGGGIRRYLEQFQSLYRVA